MPGVVIYEQTPAALSDMTITEALDALLRRVGAYGESTTADETALTDPTLPPYQRFLATIPSEGIQEFSSMMSVSPIYPSIGYKWLEASKYAGVVSADDAAAIAAEAAEAAAEAQRQADLAAYLDQQHEIEAAAQAASEVSEMSVEDTVAYTSTALVAPAAPVEVNAMMFVETARPWYKKYAWLLAAGGVAAGAWFYFFASEE